MAITVEGTSDSLESGSASTVSDTMTISSGNLLVVLVGVYNKTVSSIDDDAGNSFTKAVGIYDNSNDRSEIWYAYNTIGQSNNTVTVNFDGSNTFYKYICLIEVSGIKTSADPLDQTNSKDNSSDTTLNTNSITTTTANEFIVAQYAFYDDVDITGTTNFTDASSDIINVFYFGEYRIVSSTGTYEGSIGASSTTPCAGVIASFEAAADAGTNMKINISDSWKDVDSMKINIGDAWKDVSAVKINVGDAWKDVY